MNQTHQVLYNLKFIYLIKKLEEILLSKEEIHIIILD